MTASHSSDCLHPTRDGHASLLKYLLTRNSGPAGARSLVTLTAAENVYVATRFDPFPAPTSHLPEVQRRCHLPVNRQVKGGGCIRCDVLNTRDDRRLWRRRKGVAPLLNGGYRAPLHPTPSLAWRGREEVVTGGVTQGALDVASSHCQDSTAA